MLNEYSITSAKYRISNFFFTKTEQCSNLRCSECKRVNIQCTPLFKLIRRLKDDLFFLLLSAQWFFFYCDNICIEIQVLMILSSHNAHYKLRSMYMAIRCLYYTYKKLRSVVIRCSHNTCYKLRSVYTTNRCSYNTHYKLKIVHRTIRC